MNTNQLKRFVSNAFALKNAWEELEAFAEDKKVHFLKHFLLIKLKFQILVDATCDGAVITRENLGEEFGSCTVINGSLTITVRGGSKSSRKIFLDWNENVNLCFFLGDIWKQLRKNFGMIETITGYLSIDSADSLVTLTFLPNLKSIEGKQTLYKRYH